VTEISSDHIRIWPEGNMTATKNVFSGLNNSYGIFATINDDIYIDNGANGRVGKWTLNATNSVIAMYVKDTCFTVFVDIYENLYCVLGNYHRILKKSFNDTANISTIIAGTGVAGNESDMLHTPKGIFVDTKLNLYVADYINDRIQLFKDGQLNATTVAGSGAPETITLSYPAAVMLDADEYMFIADSHNNRIIGSGPNGFRCLVGCSGVNGSGSNQLNYPRSFSFDSYGNIFVVDESNYRIQKFFLATNSCGKCLNISLIQCSAIIRYLSYIQL
jgi:hypothetical protein